MRIERSFDVIVIGSGITGLSTAYHLRRQGVERVALAGPGPEMAATSLAAGSIAGGQGDNFTRVSQAHTMERATALWAFGDAAFDALTAYLRDHGVEHLQRRRLRLLTSPSEHREAAIAVAEMTAAGFGGRLLDVASPDLGGLQRHLLSRVIGVQDDGPRGGWVEPQRLLQQLTADTAAVPRLAAVTALSEVDGTPKLRLADGSKVTSEMVVVAAHLQARTLLPDLAPALVSYADQWLHLAVSGMPGDALGIAFSANNTYEWGVMSAPGRMRFGGARYLRPMAGVEASAASIEPAITEHLLAKLRDTFSFAGEVQVLSSHASLDINPCDELPLIGPLCGSSRVLLATGYMGTGLTTGFWAGKCLADLIAAGAAPDLPRFLWPERLRSLSS